MSSPLDRVRHAAGAIMTDGGSQSGWTVIGETLQCVHCGGHWIMEPGSGHERGYCTRCRGVVCGDRNCWECVPVDQMLTNIETVWHARRKAATDEAERVARDLGMKDEQRFTELADTLLDLKIRQIEYRARMDANIRAIRGV